MGTDLHYGIWFVIVLGSALAAHRFVEAPLRAWIRLRYADFSAARRAGASIRGATLSEGIVRGPQAG